MGTPEPSRDRSSSEKRRKRINYLEMHTGKVSPQPKVSPTGLKKKSETLDRPPSALSYESKKTKTATLKRKASLTTVLDSVDVIDDLESVKSKEADEDVLPPLSSGLKLIFINEPLEYMKDVPRKMSSKVSYIRVNSSFMRPKETIIAPVAAEEVSSPKPKKETKEKKNKEQSLEPPRDSEEK